MVSIRASRSAVIWLVLALTISACSGASSTDSSTTTTGVPQTTTGDGPRRRDDHPLDREYDLHERITDSTHGSTAAVAQRRSHRQPHQPQRLRQPPLRRQRAQPGLPPPPLPSQRRSHRQPHQPQPPLRQLQRRFRRIRVIQRTAQISLLTTRPRRGLTPTSRTTEMWLGLTATTTESLASRSPETLRLAYWFGWNAEPQRTA